MMSVAIAIGAAEARDQHIGTEGPDGAHHIADNNVMPVPFAQRFFRGLGETEVGHMAEALLHAVIFVGFQKFQRAQDAKFVGALGAEFILSAFTARDGKQQSPLRLCRALPA